MEGCPGFLMAPVQHGATVWAQFRGEVREGCFHGGPSGASILCGLYRDTPETHKCFQTTWKWRRVWSGEECGVGRSVGWGGVGRSVEVAKTERLQGAWSHAQEVAE